MKLRPHIASFLQDILHPKPAVEGDVSQPPASAVRIHPHQLSKTKRTSLLRITNVRKIIHYSDISKGIYPIISSKEKDKSPSIIKSKAQKGRQSATEGVTYHGRNDLVATPSIENLDMQE